MRANDGLLTPKFTPTINKNLDCLCKANLGYKKGALKNIHIIVKNWLLNQIK